MVVTPSQDARFPRRPALLGLLILAAVLVGFFLYASTGRDDAHITLWPAHTLAESGQILNYNGDRVEQSSSLLMVVLLAVADRLTGIDLATLAYWLSIIAFALTLVMVYALGRRVRPAAALPAVALASSYAWLLYWAFGKMEATLASFFVLAIVVTYGDFLAVERPTRRGAIFVILATLGFVTVRPEMPIVLLCVLVGTGAVRLVRRLLFLRRAAGPVAWKRAGFLLAAFVGVAGALFAFRLLYFGRLFPQPAYAKVATPDPQHLTAGWQYITSLLVGSTPLEVVLGLLMIAGWAYVLYRWIRSRFESIYLALAVPLVVAYLAYTFLSGGDWMEGGRFIVPIAPLLVLPLAWLVVDLIGWRPALNRRARPWTIATVGVLVAAQLALNYRFSVTRATGMNALSAATYNADWALEYGAAEYPWNVRANQINARDIPTAYYLDRLIQSIMDVRPDTHPVIMSGQQGFLTYYMALKYPGEVSFIDRYGLTQSTFTDCPATSGMLWRWLTGASISDVYVLDHIDELSAACGIRQPDIIIEIDVAPGNLTARGYDIYFQQAGTLPDPGGIFPIAAQPGGQIIYVRRELMPADQSPVYLDLADALQVTP